MTDDIKQPSFFRDGAEFWIGQVVSTKAQKLQIAGQGWGWRYKVRIMGSYSDADNVPDEEVHNAVVMFGVTDGTGLGGRLKPCKITQSDIVFGVFMAPDQNFPVIMGLLGPTGGRKKLDKKFGQTTGFTKELRPGQCGNQERNEQGNVFTPKVNANNENVTGPGQCGNQERNEQGNVFTPKVNANNENVTGSGIGKEVNENKIQQQLGVDINSQQVNANPKPKGIKEFEFTGFNQDDIKGMVTETENFANNIKDDVLKIGDKIKNEAPFDELKNTAERLTPELKNIAESFGADIAGGFEFL